MKRIWRFIMSSSAQCRVMCPYPLPQTGTPSLHPNYQTSLLLWVPPTSDSHCPLPRGGVVNPSLGGVVIENGLTTPPEATAPPELSTLVRGCALSHADCRTSLVTT